MNIVFWFLVLLCAFFLWVAISFIFIPIGRKVVKKVKEISDIFNYEEAEDEKEEEKKEK